MTSKARRGQRYGATFIMIIRLKKTQRITAAHLKLVDSRMIRHAGDCIVFLFQHVKSYLCLGEGGLCERDSVESPRWGGTPKGGGGRGIANDCFDATD